MKTSALPVIARVATGAAVGVAAALIPATTSPGERSMARLVSVAACSRLACVSSTPRGLPEVPEV